MGTVRYALCSDNCSEDVHIDDHVHFKCIKCGTTQCLEKAPIPGISLSNGFVVTEVSFLVKGICDKCNNGS